MFNATEPCEHEIESSRTGNGVPWKPLAPLPHTAQTIFTEPLQAMTCQGWLLRVMMARARSENHTTRHGPRNLHEIKARHGNGRAHK